MPVGGSQRSTADHRYITPRSGNLLNGDSSRLNDHHTDRLRVAVPGSDGFTIGTDVMSTLRKADQS